MLQTRDTRGWRAKQKAQTQADVPWRKRHRVQARTLPEFTPRKVATIQAPRVRQVAAPITIDFKGRVKIDVSAFMEIAISAIRNSGFSLAQIRARGGAHPKTIEGWYKNRATIQPYLGTIVATLEACDYEVDFRVTAKG